MEKMNSILKGVINRGQPQACPQDDRFYARLSRYKEFYVQQTHQGQSIADEGDYFVGTNGTPSFPVAYTQVNSFSDTTGDVILVVHNNRPASETLAKRIYLDYFRIMVENQPLSTTNLFYAIKIDNVSRQPNTNSGLTIPINTNMDSSGVSLGKVWIGGAGGALTVPASSSQARTVVAQASLRVSIPIQGDELITRFGTCDIGGSVGTTGGRFVSHAPPVVLGPQQWMVYYLWLPGNIGGSMTYYADAGWWER